VHCKACTLASRVTGCKIVSCTCFNFPSHTYFARLARWPAAWPLQGAARLSHARAPPGQTIGKIWRVGIMGYNATPANVELVLAAFREGLKAQGKLGNPDRPFLT